MQGEDICWFSTGVKTTGGQQLIYTWMERMQMVLLELSRSKLREQSILHALFVKFEPSNLQFKKQK